MKLFLCMWACMALLFACSQAPTNSNGYSITEYGAVADGKTLCTKAIQQAIDKAAANGGGIVLVPNGKFLTGTVFMKDNTTLRLEAGATLLGSTRIEDYTAMTHGHNQDRQPYHLIVAKNVKNVSIEGKGTIDGQGKYFWEKYDTLPNGEPLEPRWLKPKEKKISPLIEIVSSQNVFIEDVTVKTGGGWNIHLHDCDRVKVDGVRILNSLFSPNSDGIDITGSYDVTVSNCYIKTCDDGICLKTTPDSRDCRRITVTNCIMETSCVALKLGCNESYKDIRDVTFSNCVVDKSSRIVGIYVLEGGTFENVNISNIVGNTNAPLTLNRPIQIMCEQKTPNSKAGIIRNISISNFYAKTQGRILITAAPHTLIENIILRDINLVYPYIENPDTYAIGATSNQYPKEKNNPLARLAKAALVADNVHNLVVDNLMTTFPAPQDSIPQEWKRPERIENGGMRIFRPEYHLSQEANFNAVWLNNVQGGYINAPLAGGSTPGTEKYKLLNSTVKIRE